MAIKMFCDACKNEISRNEESSLMKFVKWALNKGGMEPVQAEELYCCDCTKKVRETVEVIKKK